MKARIENLNCSVCLVLTNAIFKHLNRVELDKLEKNKTCSAHRKGEILYKEGTRLSGVYCVTKGIVKIYKTGSEGRDQIIHFAKGGDIIGYRSVLSDEMACTTAKVLEDAVLCFISTEILNHLISTNPQFTRELLLLACKELGEANSFITDIAQKSVRERLAEALILLKAQFGLDPDQTLRVSLTREELANIVGTATESVIRLLSEFKADKLIDVNGRKIKLLNVHTLMRVGNMY